VYCVITVVIVHLNTKVMQSENPIFAVNNLAARLIYARTRLQLTQEDVAKRAGVSQGTIGNIESDFRRNPRELLAIARAVGVRPEWLKDNEQPMETAETLSALFQFGGSASAALADFLGAEALAPYDQRASPLAHAVSHRQPIVTPKTIVWEDLVKEPIEGQFLLAVRGDALMPTYPPGQMAIWQACDNKAASPGQAVLIKLPGDQFELRFMERRGSTWAGVSQRIGFGELQPERDQAVVVARLRYLDLG
jgi:transcriptional regulator with XRE-family HTH domain